MLFPVSFAPYRDCAIDRHPYQWLSNLVRIILSLLVPANTNTSSVRVFLIVTNAHHKLNFMNLFPCIDFVAPLWSHNILIWYKLQTVLQLIYNTTIMNPVQSSLTECNMSRDTQFMIGWTKDRSKITEIPQFVLVLIKRSLKHLMALPRLDYGGKTTQLFLPRKLISLHCALFS